MCPWNVKFPRDATEVAFAAREMIAGKDARTLATTILPTDDETFRVAFEKSPMKRAKRSTLARNAAVVLCNTAAQENSPTITAVQDPYSSAYITLAKAAYNEGR